MTCLANPFLKTVEPEGRDLRLDLLRAPLLALLSAGARGTAGHLAAPHLPATSLQLRHTPPPAAVPVHRGQARRGQRQQGRPGGAPPTAATHARLFLFPVLKGRAKKEKGGFPGGSAVKNPPAKAGNVGSIPGSGRSPGGGRGRPRRYSCLENPTDTGAWQATVHAVAQSWTRQGD